METTSKPFPRWIAKMNMGTGGRDHLGLGSVSSDQILPTLAPSINVLTFHPRYHSFYVFLLDEYWRKDLPRIRSAWENFFRPKEFIFSIGAYLCQQPEHGEMSNIVGGRTTGPLASKDLSSYDPTTNYIETTLGGYGLYYRSVMAELGLIIPGGRGLPFAVDVPTEPLGKDIAEAFRQAVKTTEYYKMYFHNNEIQVPKEIIKEYIHKACLCQLKTKDAPDRVLLQEVFSKGGPVEGANYRNLTMSLFLDIADLTRNFALDEELFRQIIYFGRTRSNIEYIPSSGLESIYKQWYLYQAREYYAYALNQLWDHYCFWGLQNNGDRLPLEPTSFWRYLEASLDFNDLITQLNLKVTNLTPQSRFSDLLNWIRENSDFVGEKFVNSPQGWSLLNEDLLYQIGKLNRFYGKIVIPGMIIMLAVIYLRFGRMNLWQEAEWEISKMGADGRLSLDGYVRQTKRIIDNGDSILEFARNIYEKYIIQQHILVATRKLPDNTFRFRREGIRMRFFRNDNSLSFMNSRFDSISTTVFELGYCGDMHLQDHDLTESGKQFLEVRS